MKVAVIACANGLGHVKRLIRIINRLADRTSDFKATLFCEPWQKVSLESWSEYRRFRKRPDVEIVPVSLPIRWNSDQGYYGDWLWMWHTIISTWELPRFDYVLSDNLVEPLLYADRVILSGSFLWHDVLAAAFPADQEVRRYNEWAEDIMLSTHPDMIVNRYFAMPATEQQARAFEVGLIHFCDAVGSERDKRLPKRVLVALGNAESADEQLEQVVSAMPVLDEVGAKVLCPCRWHRVLSRRCANVEPCDFDGYQLKGVDLAIIRGGLGTVSDCIAAKVPMLYVRDCDPEIEFNQGRLSDLGIGMSLQHSLQNRDSPLTDSHVYRAMVERCKGFALQGEIEAADFLLTRWGGD